MHPIERFLSKHPIEFILATLLLAELWVKMKQAPPPAVGLPWSGGA